MWKTPLWKALKTVENTVGNSTFPHCAHVENRTGCGKVVAPVIILNYIDGEYVLK